MHGKFVMNYLVHLQTRRQSFGARSSFGLVVPRHGNHFWRRRAAGRSDHWPESLILLGRGDKRKADNQSHYAAHLVTMVLAPFVSSKLHEFTENADSLGWYSFR